MKTPSKHTLALCAAQNETQLYQLALSDLCNGKVKWFGHSRTFSLGISRASGAAGGIAIERCEGVTSAYYFESYAARQLAHVSACLTGEDMEHNRELLRRRSIIEEAQAYVSASQRAA